MKTSRVRRIRRHQIPSLTASVSVQCYLTLDRGQNKSKYIPTSCPLSHSCNVVVCVEVAPGRVVDTHRRVGCVLCELVTTTFIPPRTPGGVVPFESRR